MMKRIFSALMCLLMLFTALPAMADQPQPIETIPYEQIPANANGQYHYLLLCTDSWKAKAHNQGSITICCCAWISGISGRGRMTRKRQFPATADGRICTATRTGWCW